MAPIGVLWHAVPSSISPVEWKRYATIAALRTVILDTHHKYHKAWKERNHTVAEFMSQKITGQFKSMLCCCRQEIFHVYLDDDDRLALLAPHDVRV
jgi:hypothetical protein